MNPFYWKRVLITAIFAIAFCHVASAELAYNTAWIRQFGTTSIEGGYAVAADAGGNAYFAGYTQGKLFDEHAGASDAFLLKADSEGNLQWSRQFGTPLYEEVRAIAVDIIGNVYVGGNAQLSIPTFSSADGFVRKYDGTGNLLWSNQVGTTVGDFVRSVAVNSDGEVYAAGYTQGNLGGLNAGSWDGFLSKYDADGNALWSRQFGSTLEDFVHGVAVDGFGNLYLSGRTTGSLFDSNLGSDDAFLTKYDFNGNVMWSKQFGTASDDESYSVAADAVGNVYVGGYTHGGLYGSNSGSADGFLVKYDAAGNLIWSQQFGTQSADIVRSLSLDDAGKLYVSGETFGVLAGSNFGNYDAFIRKLDSMGNVLWSRQVGSTVADRSYSVAVDGFGNAFIGGTTSGNLAGSYAGSIDVFLVKFSPVPEPSALNLSLAVLCVTCRRWNAQRVGCRNKIVGG